MEYKNGIISETWKDRVKDYATLTAVALPGLIALWCWGAVTGASLERRYLAQQEEVKVQTERAAQQDSNLKNILDKK